MGLKPGQSRSSDQPPNEAQKKEDSRCLGGYTMPPTGVYADDCKASTEAYGRFLESLKDSNNIDTFINNLEPISHSVIETTRQRKELLDALNSAISPTDTKDPDKVFDKLFNVKETLERIGVVLTVGELYDLADSFHLIQTGGQDTHESLKVAQEMHVNAARIDFKTKIVSSAARELFSTDSTHPGIERVNLDLGETLQRSMGAIEKFALLARRQKEMGPSLGKGKQELYGPVKKLLEALGTYTEAAEPLLTDATDSVVRPGSHQHESGLDNSFLAPYLRSLDFSRYTPLERALLGVAVGLDRLGLKDAADCANSLCSNLGLKVPPRWFLGRWTTPIHHHPIGPIQSYAHGFRDMALQVVDTAISFGQICGWLLKQTVGIQGDFYLGGRFADRIDEDN